jgi:anti-anti-sigma regulatory factor
VADIEQKEMGETMYLTVAGRIDDTTEFPSLPPTITKLVLQLGGVTSISAVGVRVLEELLTTAPAATTLIQVPAAVAMQINLVPSLARVADVQTALLPFSCPGCGAERRHLVPWRAGADRRWAPTCDCGASMELDGIAEHYLPPPAEALASA